LLKDIISLLCALCKLAALLLSTADTKTFPRFHPSCAKRLWQKRKLRILSATYKSVFDKANQEHKLKSQ
jgi:hypothetical protein